MPVYTTNALDASDVIAEVACSAKLGERDTSTKGPANIDATSCETSNKECGPSLVGCASIHNVVSNTFGHYKSVPPIDLVATLVLIKE